MPLRKLKITDLTPQLMEKLIRPADEAGIVGCARDLGFELSEDILKRIVFMKKRYKSVMEDAPPERCFPFETGEMVFDPFPEEE